MYYMCEYLNDWIHDIEELSKSIVVTQEKVDALEETITDRDRQTDKLMDTTRYLVSE